MAPLTAAVILPTRPLWEQAHACIQTVPVRIAVEQNEPIDADALLDRIERHRVDVVLVEANGIGLPLDEFIRRLHSTTMQPAVFVLHTEPSPQLILEALRARAAEFLFPPLADSLRTAFIKLSAVRSKQGGGSSRQQGKLFGFISARGGCGASTFAVHVAASLGRQLDQPLLLADLDFEAGMLRFLMKSKSPYSVRDAFENLHRMDATYWKALVTSHPPKLDFIAAPEELTAKRPRTPEEVVQLMRFIRANYPVAILDFGRSVSTAALAALPEMEALYLVSTPDLMTLEFAKRALGIFEGRTGAADRVEVLLNRVQGRGAPDSNGVVNFIGQTPAGCFTDDFMSLYNAYSEGTLLDASRPLAKSLHTLATSIRAKALGEKDHTQESSRQPVASGGKRWFSFLQRAQA